MITDQKTGIMYRLWEHPDPEAVLLLVHGLGAHSGRWDPLSEYFLKNNISSYALELKGFGSTEGPRGHIDTFATYFNDINRFYERLNCTPESSDDEIKTNYKKLVKDFHPDTIISKGLPEEFTAFATTRFQEIQEAYETIKQKRNM